MNKIDVLSLVNSQMKAVLAKEETLAGDANDTSVGFEVMRENYVLGRQYWVSGGPKMVASFDEKIDGPYGQIPVRFYYPTKDALAGKEAGETKTPAIVYVHGGGWVLGNLDTHDRICRVLANKSEAVVVAVDYQLSPEAKFPVAVHEVAAVSEYLHDNCATYGIDGDRMGMAGDSGGAHLNLAATLYLRQEKGGAEYIKALLLYYGWFGLSDSASQRLLGGPWDGLTREDFKFYKELYAGSELNLEEEPYVNLFLNDLTHDMPACYIAGAEFDPLRDDSYCLAAILEEANLPFEYEEFEGVIHAFLHYTKGLDAANDALEHGATFFRNTVGMENDGLL